MISVQRLEGFYWVARLEGYTRAARAFPYPITQPGVQQQVRRLEADLGHRLLEREGQDRMVMTPAGRELFELVAPFFDRLPNVERAIRAGVTSRVLRVQSSPHLVRHLLPAWLRRIQRLHPMVDIELTEALVPSAQPLLSGESDLVVDHFADAPRGAIGQRVATARAFVVIPHARGRGRADSTLGSLRDEAFIAYGADGASRALQLQALKSHDISPRRVISAGSAETILGLVAAGLGYSIVPSVEPNGPHASGVLTQRLTRPVAEFPILALGRGGARQNPLVGVALQLAPEPSTRRFRSHQG